jgi:hypothetical protein
VDNFAGQDGLRWAYHPAKEVTIVTREIIDDRWRTLIIGPDGQGREGTSELYDRLTASVAELAVRMVHGLRDDGHETESLIGLTFRVEQLVERAVKEYAFEIETNRLVRSEPRVKYTSAVS